MIDIDRILEELKVLPQYESQIMLQTTDNGQIDISTSIRNKE